MVEDAPPKVNSEHKSSASEDESQSQGEENQSKKKDVPQSQQKKSEELMYNMYFEAAEIKAIKTKQNSKLFSDLVYQRGDALRPSSQNAVTIHELSNKF